MINDQPLNTQDLGKLAFEAYCTMQDGKSHNGQPIPQWDALKPSVKAAWEMAAVAVASRTWATFEQGARRGQTRY